MKKDNDKEDLSPSGESEESVDEEEIKNQIKNLQEQQIKQIDDSLKKSKNIDKRKLQFGTRTSIAPAIFGRKYKTAPDSKFQIARIDMKKFTSFKQDSLFDKEKIDYPLENLRPIKINITAQKELICIYLNEEFSNITLYKLKRTDVYAIENEKDIFVSLIRNLPTYYQKIFKNKGNIEERLKISMSEKMKHIKPNYTIAIEMDEKLRNSEIVQQQTAKYLQLKKDILKHIDEEQSDLIKFDPFSKVKIRENDNEIIKKPLRKWAVSLKMENEEFSDDEDSEEESSRKQSELNIENIIKEDLKGENDENNSEEEKEIKNESKEKQNSNKKKEEEEEEEEEEENEEEEEDKEDEEKEEKEEKEEEEEENEDDEKIFDSPYGRILKNLFYPKLDYFRKHLMKKLLNQFLKENIFNTRKQTQLHLGQGLHKKIHDNQSFQLDFEKFICLLEFFISLFTGIQVKYSIDELGFLNMDLYADELNYMNMAEILHYQVQFQIRDISHTSDKDNKINPKLIIHLNNCQYEDFNKDKIEFFPPSTTFIKELSNHYRRYTHNDNYHLCEECEKMFVMNEYKEVQCNSSVFRFIDKVRLLTMTLYGVLDKTYLEKAIEKKENEGNEEEQNEEEDKIFKTTMILRNEDVFNEFKLFDIIQAYLCPIINKPILKLNNTFRNIFGEIIGYYYTWISHYISWVIVVAIIGLIAEILIVYIKDTYVHNYIYIIFFIIFSLWGFYYVRDWKKYEKFYNHIWGMDSFQAEITGLYDENYSKVHYVTFLDIKIPKVDKLSALMVNFISIVLVLLSSLFIMGINVGIFKINKVDNFLFKYVNKFFAYFGLSKNISKYTLPILIYIAREIISKIFYEISAILAILERPTDKNEYEETVTKKRLTLEFVNYYFNLYYIMLYKKRYNKCENGDCFQELRKQLILILISNICSVIIEFVYKIIYWKQNIKNFEIKMKQAYEKNSDYIEKLKFYTRELFTEDDIQKLIIPIIFNFGYVIQFGICCPISFFFMFILIIFIRLTNAISMIYVFYVKTLSISKGLLVYNNTQNLFIYVGLFSNLCLLFYTKNTSSELKLIYKLFIIVIIQNGVVIIYNIIRFKSLPFWFRYRKIVKLKYLKNFGVIQNKNKKIDKKDNQLSNSDKKEITPFKLD